MKIVIWKHPKNANDVRAYLNAIEGLDGETKAFVKAGSAGCKLSVQPAADIPAVIAALGQEGLLDSRGKVTGVPFSHFEAKASAPRRQSAPAQAPSGSRREEADMLDLTSIDVPEPVKIEIDHREPAELFSILGGLNNVEVARVDLDVGDVHINDGAIIVERKCCTSANRSDFEASVIDDTKRLFFQSEKMRLAENTLPIILIEGPVHEASRSMLLQQIDGAISFLMTLQGLSVINTLSLNHTAYFLLKLAVHHRSGLGYSLSFRGKKPSLLSDQVAFTLEGIPGISAKTARLLSDRFGSLAAVTAASKDDLLQIPGLGKKRLDTIWPVLHGTH